MSKTRSYILCTAPRSGSTLLCSLLRASGVAGVPESYFHRDSVADWARELDLPEKTPLPRVLAAARIEGDGGTGVFGLRLQRASVPFLMTQLAALYPEAESDAARMAAAFGAPVYVHLRRGDLLGQAISRVRAEQSGLWHRAADGSELERLAPPAEHFYDRAALAAALAEGERLNVGWEDWFAAEGIEPLRVTYEELSADPGAVLARVLAFIGSDPARAEGVQPGTSKLADALSGAWRARFLAGD